MPIQSSGVISMSDIVAEFGGSAPHSISEYRGVGTTPSSGAISWSNFYGQSAFNAQWSGNSVYYNGNGLYGSGSNFYFRAQNSNGSTLSASSSGTFTNGSSTGGSTNDLNGVRGYGNNRLSPAHNGSYTSSYITFTIGSGFSGTADAQTSPFVSGFQTSGGNMRCRNGNRYGAYIGLS
jgi:hypothetical protein